MLKKIYLLPILAIFLHVQYAFAACCPWDPKCKNPGDPKFCNSETTSGTSSYWTQPGSPPADPHNTGNGVPTGWYGEPGTPPPNPKYQDTGAPNGRADYYTCQKQREACGENDLGCFKAYNECLIRANPCLGDNPPSYCQ